MLDIVLLQVVILCYQLAVSLACPLNCHLSLPSLGPVDASCASYWTPFYLNDCLPQILSIYTGIQQPREKKKKNAC